LVIVELKKEDVFDRTIVKANGVSANGTSTDARAAMVRVICVRK